MTRRLRIAQLVVNPVLIWDDGETIEPGPQLNPIPVTLGGLADLAASLPAEVAALEAQLLLGQAAPPPANREQRRAAARKKAPAKKAAASAAANGKG
jgi:hypothetical protein